MTRFSTTALAIAGELAAHIGPQDAVPLHASIMDWSHLDEPDSSGADPSSWAACV